MFYLYYLCFVCITYILFVLSMFYLYYLCFILLFVAYAVFHSDEFDSNKNPALASPGSCK